MMMNKKNPAAETATAELVAMAKNGDSMAHEQLLNRCMPRMRRVHEYGRDGFYCKNVSEFALSFNEALEDIYKVFNDAVRLYDAAKGASFETFLEKKLSYGASTRIRNAMKARERELEQQEMMGVTAKCGRNGRHVVDMDGEDGYSAAETSEKEYAVGEDHDNDLNFAKAQVICGLYKADSSKARALVALMCGSGNPKKAVSEIAAALDCSRQNADTLLRGIRKDLAQRGIGLSSRFE